MAGAQEHHPLTTVIARRVRPGKEAAYEEWLEGILAAAARFDGHQGITVLRPAPGGREYVLVARWRDFESSRRWVESEERGRWMASLDCFAEGEGRFEEQSGLETWFTLRPGQGGGPAPPPRIKMAVVTFLAIYPLILVLSHFLVPRIAVLPWAVRPIVMCGILVPLMTWVVMPQMTKLFWSWLYPGFPRRTAAPDPVRS
jgi:uncharacterized protein